MQEKLTLKEFLSLYKNVDRVRGSDKQGTLFESICYLLENEPNNPKTRQALEKVIYNYVKIYKINHSAEPTTENIQKLTEGMTIPETCHIIGLPNGSRTSGLVSIYYDLLDGRKLTIYGVKTIDSIQLD